MHTTSSGQPRASSLTVARGPSASVRSSALWVLLLASACSAGGSDPAEIPGVAGDPPPLGGAGQPGGAQNPGGFVPGGPDLGAGAVAPGADGTFSGIPTCETCEDFPAAPIFEDGLAADTAALFQGTGAAAGACVIEPRDGMLIPANMLRPRVRFSGTGDVHQITLHAEREANDLVVYTRKNPWLIPPEVWEGVSKNVFDEDITVTVRSASAGGQASAPSSVKFRIAPVQAGGSMIYWAATRVQAGLDPTSPFQYSTSLLGFSVGEEAVIATLKPSDVTETMLGDNGEVKKPEFDAPAGQARCVGCHTSTGDGKAIVSVDHWPWNYAVTDISGVGGRPDYMTDLGALLLQMPWLGVSTSSRGDWALGNRRLVTSAGPRAAATDDAVLNPDQPAPDIGFTRADSQATGRDILLWLNLAAEGGTIPDMTGTNIAKPVSTAMIAAKGTGWGVIARTGDTRGAVTPDWSHDGTSIVYTSTDSTKDGHVGDNANNVDIYRVPYNAGAGGQAAPVAGASEPGVAEYYPDFSADDRYIAFNRVQNGTGRIYYKAEGEIYVVPASGGTAIRLAANDPPSCTMESSPGVTNSWPKWSPTVRTGPEGTPAAGNKYYFLLFSSTRQSPRRLDGNVPASQLYLTTMVEHADGTVQTYPAMYLWNQGFLITNPDPNNPQVTPIQTSNLTPAFDEFLIPPRPPVIVR
jgi:WD40 repeat protein